MHLRGVRFWTPLSLTCLLIPIPSSIQSQQKVKDRGFLFISEDIFLFVQGATTLTKEKVSGGVVSGYLSPVLGFLVSIRLNPPFKV